MKHSYHSYKRPPNLRKIQKYLSIFFLFIFLIILSIPTIIVFSEGNGPVTMNKPLSSLTSQKTSVATKNNNTSVNRQTVSKESPLSIGWATSNDPSRYNLSTYHNLKVVSPALVPIDTQYTLKVNSNPPIIQAMQVQNQKVWVRFIIKNDTKSNVHTFLSSPSKIQEIIKEVYETTLTNQWDGINLDIENVRSQDRNLFSVFVRNLSTTLKQSKIVLSIDLPPDSNGSNKEYGTFDYKALGNYCDYLIFMGYDQHWSPDPILGPVTSLSWLKENVQEFGNKIILGKL